MIIALGKNAVAVIELFGVDEFSLVAVFPEEFDENSIFSAVDGLEGLFEFENSDVGLFLPAIGLVGLEKGGEEIFCAAEFGELIFLAELFDGRGVVEHIGEEFAVSKTGCRGGLEVAELKIAVVQVGVEKRSNVKKAIAGINGGEHAFCRQEFHALQEAGSAQGQGFHAFDSGEEGFASLRKLLVLLLRQKVRPEKRRGQARTDNHAMGAHALCERIRPFQVGMGLSFENFVIANDCVVHKFLRHQGKLCYQYGIGLARIKAEERISAM